MQTQNEGILKIFYLRFYARSMGEPAFIRLFGENIAEFSKNMQIIYLYG